MLTRAKMRTFLLPLSFLCLGLFRSTDALCSLDNGFSVNCHELKDAKYIDKYDIESLTASVRETSLTSALLKNLTGLKHLDLSGGDIEDVGTGTFSQMDRLRSLSLAHNSIEHLKLTAFDGLDNLKSIDLRKNRIRQLPAGLIRLKGLRTIDVSGNPLVCNCASLRVRDLLVARGVKISKKTYCSSPSNLKGTSLLKPDAEMICMFEVQDDEMQRDESAELGSGDLEGSGEPDSEDVEGSGSVDVAEDDSLLSRAAFPFGEDAKDAVNVSDASDEKSTSGEFDFIGEGEKQGISPATPSGSEDVEKPGVMDDIIIPVEGSGATDAEEEEGSGLEGSGTGMVWPNWDDSLINQEASSTQGPSSSTEGWFDTIFSGWGSSTTVAPEDEEGLDLEQEEFIDVTSEKPASEKTPVDEEKVLTRVVVPDLGHIPNESSTAEPVSSEEAPAQEEPNATVATTDTSKSGKVLIQVESSTLGGINEEMGEVSPTRESKKGMGSYVVLAILLTILAALIGLAAYKGDFCSRKRKRNDVERGTELKDVEKSLLDGNKSPQPKISSNGNAESAPLVGGPDREWKDSKPWKDQNTPRVDDRLKSAPNVPDLEPVKPPRNSLPPQDEPKGVTTDGKPLEALSTFAPAISSPMKTPPNTPMPVQSVSPPLSPNAQRVKITLQDNPDSVPRTPILITRTKAGENLVKTS